MKESLAPLVAKVRADFELAKTAKQPINTILNRCLDLFLSKYDAQSLAEIRKIGGSEIFVPLTNMKVRAGKAWLTDIFFQPNEILFDLKPTPLPDLPDEIEEQIRTQLYMEFQQIANQLGEIYAISGGQYSLPSLEEFMRDSKMKLEEEYRRKIEERATKLCELEKRRIHDCFVEGGFYEAFSECIHDIMIYPCAILKGVVLRKQKKFITTNKTALDIVVPTFNRVSPFDIFPAPNMVKFDDDYVIEVIHLLPKDLYSLIGIDGFHRETILEAISKYSKGYRESYTQNEQDQNFTTHPTIDILEYWGSLQGAFLEECGVSVEDKYAFYDVCVWVLDNMILKAVVNPHPLGIKPYFKTSFIELPDSFWGIALPQVLEPIQTAVNALARASINNSVISSGALIERNIDRIGDNASKEIRPFEIFDVTESTLNSAPAYRFYQLNPIAQQVIILMSEFQKMADEYSGIPAYAHGDVTVGGAGRTASGLSMLTSNASRGIKEVIKNIDEGIIKPAVKMQYYFNLVYYIKDPAEIPDLSIEARGSTILAEKQAMVTRMLEYLQMTNNPFDIQLLGADGRRYLLETIAKNSGIDHTKIFSINQNLIHQIMQQQGTVPPSINEVPQLTAQAQEFGQSVNEFKKEHR